MFDWLRNLLGTKRTSRPAVPVRGRYDNAQTTDENRKMWALTDLLSAAAANSFQARQILRTRSRYEVANGSYAQGIVETTVNDLIGTGPQLQVLTEDEGVNNQIEAAFAQWCCAVDLTEKLRTMTFGKRTDGEGFLLLTTYSRVESPVQLYPRDLETDQITTPNPGFNIGNWVDGVVLDEIGKPLAYHVLKKHPGDLFFNNLSPLDYDTIPARFVLHFFKKTRPGQVRGVPELTPALDLFGQLRRYTKAVLAAAELAADVAGMLESEASPDPDTTEPSPFSTVDMERGTLMELPAGYKFSQVRAEQPVTTYDMFTERIIAEACRCLSIPLNKALGTSQKFNFSSARLDHLDYHAGLRVERRQCERTVLSPLFLAWLNEAVMVPNLLPAGLSIADLPIAWRWPGFPYMDPLKDAQADTERLNNHTGTLAQIYGEQGLDWENELRQRAKEADLMKELGLTVAQSVPIAPDQQDANEETANAA